MIMFACVHVADGSPIWLLERGHAREDVPENLQACCEVCAPQMERLGANDIRVLDLNCARRQLNALTGEQP